jgi:hypothetical protein
VQIDDTGFATSSHGVILVPDRDGETVPAISRNIFSPGAAYSATPTSVAALDLDTGVLANVVTGMASPHGMAFINKQELFRALKGGLARAAPRCLSLPTDLNPALNP